MFRKFQKKKRHNIKQTSSTFDKQLFDKQLFDKNYFKLERSLKKMDFSHAGMDLPLIPNPSGSYYATADHVCPKCGWKNSKSYSPISTCVECQTGMVQVKGKWQTVNSLIDPHEVLVPYLKSQMDVRAQDILKDQSRHIRKAWTMNFGNSPINIEMLFTSHYKFAQEWENYMNNLIDDPYDVGSLFAVVMRLNLDPQNPVFWNDFIHVSLIKNYIYFVFVGLKYILNSELASKKYRKMYCDIFEVDDGFQALTQSVTQNFYMYHHYVATYLGAYTYHQIVGPSKIMNNFLGSSLFYLNKIQLSLHFLNEGLRCKTLHHYKIRGLRNIDVDDLIKLRLGQAYLLNNQIKKAHTYLAKAQVKQVLNPEARYWYELCRKAKQFPHLISDLRRKHCHTF